MCALKPFLRCGFYNADDYLLISAPHCWDSIRWILISCDLILVKPTNMTSKCMPFSTFCCTFDAQQEWARNSKTGPKYGLSLASVGITLNRIQLRLRLLAIHMPTHSSGWISSVFTRSWVSTMSEVWIALNVIEILSLRSLVWVIRHYSRVVLGNRNT